MTAKKHLYIILDVVREEPAGADLAAYRPQHEPTPGTVTLQSQKIPDGAALQLSDGPITWHAAPGHLGAFEESPDGTGVTVPYTTQRIVELVNAGLEMEKTLRAQIHAGFEEVRSLVDDIITDGDLKYDIIKRMDDIEKRLM